jgi:hypothetical protein
VRRRASPPVITLVTLLMLLGAASLLGVAASTGSRASATLTGSVPWFVWKVVAALALVVFVALFLLALQILRHRPEWGLTGADNRVRQYVILAALAVAAIAAFLVLVGSSPDIPVRDLTLRTRTVLLAGVFTSIPWLALVWLAHAECNDLDDELTPGPPGSSGGPAAQPRQPAQPALLNARLLLLWKLLGTCVTAFAVLVVAAIVNSGALRASFLAAHPARGSEFPPSNVLFYGAFFAVILAVITIPLVASWRACAFRVVEGTCPLPADGQPTEDWFAARARLEKLLHLDVPLLRNPLTALSIFVPLITAALAAFVPQLGMG